MSLNSKTIFNGKWTWTRLYPIHTVVSLFIVGVWVTILLTACQGKTADRTTVDVPKEVATLQEPAISPSGAYLLVVMSGYDSEAHFQSFQIVRRDQIMNQDQVLIRIGETLYSSSDRFATRFTTYFVWDQEDRVWVYSGDIGTFFWEHNADAGRWEKHSYVESNVSAPEFLKEVRPDYHQK